MSEAAVATVTTTEAKSKGRPGRPVDPNSAVSRARAIVVAGLTSGKSRKDILKEIQEQCNTTEGTAQVYFHNGKSAYNASNPAPTTVEAPSDTTESV